MLSVLERGRMSVKREHSVAATIALAGDHHSGKRSRLMNEFCMTAEESGEENSESVRQQQQVAISERRNSRRSRVQQNNGGKQAASRESPIRQDQSSMQELAMISADARQVAAKTTTTLEAPNQRQQQQQQQINKQENICAACGKPIKERYLLMALDKQWHEDCLKCDGCNCRLGEVGRSLFTRANKILCRTDFLRIFGQRGHCAACKREIPPYEMVMRANDLTYHMDCFSCQHCQYRFCVGDQFHLTDLHRIICVSCHRDQQQQQNPPNSSAAFTPLVRSPEIDDSLRQQETPAASIEQVCEQQQVAEQRYSTSSSSSSSSSNFHQEEVPGEISKVAPIRQQTAAAV